ncbi:hypothetical protein CX676_08575 [Paracoccus zhejiangensis]|uniref:Uncharacterized protein n=1 Tax=Paracoccus zhejiangensis TaxID=1077935 RepID=A0A2H5EY19_9RHOB|nr:hypothetical protein CX676_08575 [Paracoccus zhejiangensis]
MDGDLGFRGGLGELQRDGMRVRGRVLDKTGGDGLFEAFMGLDRQKRRRRGAYRIGCEGWGHSRNAGLCGLKRCGGRVTGDGRRLGGGGLCCGDARL